MIDFKQDNSGDLEIQAGDLVLTESTIQHQRDIILAQKGWWHFAPTQGVGLNNWMHEHGSQGALMGEIRRELERDGATVSRISMNDGKLIVEATYEQ